MPDISMCSDNACPARAVCRRHEDSGTKPSEAWQTYAEFHHDETGKCEHYWPRGNQP